MIVAGDEVWQGFSLSVTFKPESTAHHSGVVFHYQNYRCYYFFGVDGNKTVLKMVKHGSGFHQPFEKILSQTEYQWQPGESMKALVQVTGSRNHARLGDGLVLEADDSTYQKGKIGLTANSPTKFMGVKVTTSEADKKTYEAARAEFEKQERQLQAENPRPMLWKKIDTEGFGVGRNLRFGDLDNDGDIAVLIGQVLHHGPKERNNELS